MTEQVDREKLALIAKLREVEAQRDNAEKQVAIRSQDSIAARIARSNVRAVEEWASTQALVSKQQRYIEELEQVDSVGLKAKLREAEAVISEITRAHRPVHAVFNWRSGLRYEEPCETCGGKPGIHKCGCWQREQIEFVCLECDEPNAGGQRRVTAWPCSTTRTLAAYKPTNQEGSTER